METPSQSNTAFNQSASTYDAGSFIQQKTRQQLYVQLVEHPTFIESLSENSSSIIMDLGCGTGKSMIELESAIIEKQATLVGEGVQASSVVGPRQYIGVDSAPLMIEQAKQACKQNGIEASFSCSSFASLSPSALQSVTGYVSVASLQWEQDLPSLLKQLKQASKQKLPWIAFSIYIKPTLYELHTVLQDIGHTTQIPSQSFTTSADLSQLFNSNLQVWDAWQYQVKQPFDSVLDVLKHFRLTGAKHKRKANNMAPNWTPATIKKMDDIFHRLYGGVFLTYTSYNVMGALNR